MPAYLEPSYRQPITYSLSAAWYGMDSALGQSSLTHDPHVAMSIEDIIYYSELWPDNPQHRKTPQHAKSSESHASASQL